MRLPVVTMVTGDVIAPGNAMVARAFIWRADGERDDAGPLTAFLAVSNAANAPATLRAQCTATGFDGKWDITIDANAMNPNTCAQHFKTTLPVWLHVVQEGVAHRTLALKYQVSA